MVVDVNAQVQFRTKYFDFYRAVSGALVEVYGPDEVVAAAEGDHTGSVKSQGDVAAASQKRPSGVKVEIVVADEISYEEMGKNQVSKNTIDDDDAHHDDAVVDHIGEQLGFHGPQNGDE